MAIESPDDEIEGVENVVGEDASSRPDAVAVPLRVVGVRLCDEPLNLVSLGDAFGAGGRGSWIVRDSLGACSVSVGAPTLGDVRRVRDAREPPNRVGGCSRASDVVRPDLEQRDPARRAPIAEVAADEDARITFLCEDARRDASSRRPGAASRAIGVRTSGRARARRLARRGTWCLGNARRTRTRTWTRIRARTGPGPGPGPGLIWRPRTSWRCLDPPSCPTRSFIASPR